MSFSLPRYNPEFHAKSAAPQFTQAHVVVGEVPLTRIDFDPNSDELAKIETIGHRMPRSCPFFEHLTADSRTPPIQGAEQRQSLGVSCAALATANVTPIAYPVCIGKMASLGLGPDDIRARWLTDRETYQQLSCPFTYLGAAVVRGKARVEVALTAYNPLGDLSLDTI